MTRSLIVPSLLLFLTCGACDDQGPAPAPGEASGKSVETSAPAAAPEAEPKRETERVTGKVKGPKGEVGFAVDLPKGLIAVDESPGMAMYRRGKDDFEGYNFAIAVERDKRPLELERARFEAAMKDPRKKGKVLDSGTIDEGGWYVAASFEEGGKRNVTLMANVGSGEVVLMCRGDATGELTKDEEAAAKTLRETCASLHAEG
ncbi:MAG: hypothetical protein R3B72_33445 [Polyangiaceae bacterium]